MAEPRVEKKKRIRRSRAEIEAFEAAKAEESKKVLAGISKTIAETVEKQDSKKLPEVVDLTPEPEPTEPIEPEKPKRRRVKTADELAIGNPNPLACTSSPKRVHVEVRPDDAHLPVNKARIHVGDCCGGKRSVDTGAEVFLGAPVASRVRPQDVLPTLERALERRDPRYRLKFAAAGAALGAAVFYVYAPNILLASSNFI